MYNGNENLINDGEYLQYSMLDFWKWAYSNLILNVSRGTFAEFIVKSALDRGGFTYNSEMKTGFEPYDLDGPAIQSLNRLSRIEVKSAAFVQLWDIKHPDKASFSIAPAKLPDETGDYREDAPRQRNNDIYVFTLYTAQDRTRNILDLSWWKFYVLPTFKIENDPQIKKQKTISLKKIEKMCTQLSFDDLCSGIVDACNSISENSEQTFPPPPEKTFSFLKIPCRFNIQYWEGLSFLEKGWILLQPFFDFGFHIIHHTTSLMTPSRVICAPL